MYANVYVCNLSIMQLVPSSLCLLCIMNVYSTIFLLPLWRPLMINKEIELNHTTLKNDWIFMIDYDFEDFFTI